MKRLALTIAVLLSINISTIWAEGNSTNTLCYTSSLNKMLLLPETYLRQKYETIYTDEFEQNGIL